ncbi:MAG TPA: hypothetical protein VH300_08865 [Thermoleophilaceae bacterium]|jgi:hypothetical protein|nr:hypothetical protein [Thermoleophilaceae bacterium]
MSTSSNTSTSTTPLQARLGAASGAAFAIALFVAAGDGKAGYSQPRAVIGTIALVLFVPFLAFVASLLRAAEPGSRWLSTTALAAGITGITMKLLSGGPEVAIHRAHVADGTQLHEALKGIAGAATVASLYPFALFLAVVAVVALRTAVLPRWVGISAAVVALALAINGAIPTTESVPALLLFIVWTLSVSVSIYRGARSESRRLGQAYSAA